MARTILIRHIEDIPPRERPITLNHLYAMHPVVFDEQIQRLKDRVENRGGIGAWEIHDHHLADKGGGVPVCTRRCTRVDTVEPGDPRLPQNGGYGLEWGQR